MEKEGRERGEKERGGKSENLGEVHRELANVVCSSAREG